MSMGTALSNAYSGLTASSRIAEVISSNVANALNENYSRRTVELAADSIAGIGAGVKISGVVRFEDTVAVAARRGADADSALSTVLASAYARLGNAVGSSDEAGSLPNRLIAFESALVSSAATPESSSMQANLLSASQSLVATVANISTENQRIRMDADAEISRQVDLVNSALTDIDQLNREIQMQIAGGNDAAALMDQRKQLIDSVASIIPIKSIRRPGDQIALFSVGGLQLLDGNPAKLGFSPADLITSDMTLAGGALSGLTVNGNAVTIGNGAGLFDGGSLSAAFSVRDIVVPNADTQLDTFAADLISRFESATVDPSIAPGMAGLFTDNSSALNLADVLGLAGRLALNSAVDPVQGGALWHLRDGLYATVPGNSGSGTVLSAMRDAVVSTRVPLAGGATDSPVNLAQHAGEIVSSIGVAAHHANENSAFHNAKAATFREAELAAVGVDTDYEMQNLMLVEQAYAANARVIAVIDSLLRTLTEI